MRGASDEGASRTSRDHASGAKRCQRSQLPIGLVGCAYQALFTFRPEQLHSDELQGRPYAVSLQGSRERSAICIVVQLPETSLRFTQVLQRSLLSRKPLTWKQVSEEFG